MKIDLIIDLQNSKRTSVYAFILRIFSKTKINGTGGFSTHRYKYDKMNMPSVIDGLSNLILNKDKHKFKDNLYPPQNRCPSNFTKCPCLN